MTLSKLSRRNARRQARDYLVYFVTITMAAALIYAFNGLVDSSELQSLSSMLEAMPLMIIVASIVVVFIIGWLINYTMRFMLEKRSRELGTYILMGLEKRQVSRLFFNENLLIGGMALVLGTFLGNLLFQALRAIILNLFNVPYVFRFSFTLSAIGLTLLYFMLIYLFASIRCRRQLRKMKIHDLVYYDRKNEVAAVKSDKSRKGMFVFSIICGIIGTALLISGRLGLGLLGAVFIIIFLYCFFISFSSGVPAFFDRHPNKKFKHTNLLVFRSLSAKLNTMGVTMATISLLLTATLIAVGAGVLFSHGFQRQQELTTSFDLFISGSVGSDFSKYKTYIDEHIPVTASHAYYVYETEEDAVMQYLSGKMEENGEEFYYKYEKDTVMRYSDYLLLREMLGLKPPVSLPDNGYIIHCSDYVKQFMETYQSLLTIDGKTLTQSGVYSENFNQYYWLGNGDKFILIVPDEVAENCLPFIQIYAAMTKAPVDGEFYASMKVIRDEKAQVEKTSQGSYVSGDEYDMILSIGGIREENASMNATIVFPLFYLALILVMTSATILTIQLLSDTPRYQKQFTLLNQLGMSGKDMTKAIRRQFALFYTMPVIPALLVSTAFTVALASVFDTGIILGALHLLSLVGLVLAAFLIIYLIYIVVSYTSFRRNILANG